MRNRQITVAVLAAFFLLTLATGMVGWSIHYKGPDGTRWGDAAYNTLLAFTGDASYLGGDTELNRWLLVTRFTGLLTTISALIAVAGILLGAQIMRVAAWLRRDHSVMVGASNFMLKYQARDGQVTVFDTAERLEVLRVDGRPWRVLKLACRMTADVATGASLGAPARVLFGDADSITNIERAGNWLDRAPVRRVKHVELILRIEDNSVARDLDLLRPEFAHARVVSRAETGARSLVTAMAPAHMAYLRGQDRVHVVLVGLGSMNLAVAEELALRCHHPKLGALCLTLVDCDPMAARARLQAERPDLLNPDFGGDGPHIRFVDLDALQCCAPGAASALLELEAEQPITAMVVSAGPDTRNTAIAMRLREIQLQSLRLRAPIFTRRRLSESMAPAGNWPLTGSIVPFGGRIPTAEDLELEQLYQVQAKAVHDIWRNAPDVVRTPENAWENLTATHRRSSYRAAMFAVEVLYGADFVPPVESDFAGMRLHPGAGHAALADDELIEALAAVEHQRWNTERRLEGFRTAKDGLRDNEKRLHPMIVPFGDLPNEQADKDRRNVRAILHNGVERHEQAPKAPCWRKALRIGLIGPLLTDADAVAPRVSAALDALLRDNPDAADYSLEILTPNAPGFDRLAAVALADAWLASCKRPCRVLAFNAAGPVFVDRIAVDGVIARTPGLTREVLSARFAAERSALSALAGKGHLIGELDFRPLGLSDADMNADPDAYMATVRRIQNHILTLADEVMIDPEGGTWSDAALHQWTEARGRENLFSLQPF